MRSYAAIPAILFSLFITSGVAEAKPPKQNPPVKKATTVKELIETGKIICTGSGDFDKIIFKKADFIEIRAVNGKYKHENVSGVTIVFKCNDGHTFIMSGPNTNQINNVESIPPTKRDAPRDPGGEDTI